MRTIFPAESTEVAEESVPGQEVRRARQSPPGRRARSRSAGTGMASYDRTQLHALTVELQEALEAALCFSAHLERKVATERDESAMREAVGRAVATLMNLQSRRL